MSSLRFRLNYLKMTGLLCFAAAAILVTAHVRLVGEELGGKQESYFVSFLFDGLYFGTLTFFVRHLLSLADPSKRQLRRQDLVFFAFGLIFLVVIFPANVYLCIQAILRRGLEIKIAYLLGIVQMPVVKLFLAMARCFSDG